MDIVYSPLPQNITTPLICYQLPYLLHMKTILLIWPLLVTPQTCISLVKNSCYGPQHDETKRGCDTRWKIYFSRKHYRIRLNKKSIFFCVTCSINKRFYYWHGTKKIHRRGIEFLNTKIVWPLLKLIDLFSSLFSIPSSVELEFWALFIAFVLWPTYCTLLPVFI